MEEEQTTQWPKEKVQKDKQRSTTYTYKTKDRVTRTPLKTGGELRYSGRISSSCSISDIHRMQLALIRKREMVDRSGNWFPNLFDNYRIPNNFRYKLKQSMTSHFEYICLQYIK